MTTPVHVTGEVLASRKAGAYRLLTLVAPGVAERFRPGAFVALSVGESLLGRRAFWVHRVKPTGGYGATLDIVVSPVGPGTRWLAALPPGSRVEVTGPLGRPFALPKEPARCLLVGEAYAAAPLFPLASGSASASARPRWSSAPPTRPTCSTPSRRAAQRAA